MTDLVPMVGFGFAFLAGLISFLSPCVVPLIPGYLSYVSGVSIDNLGRPSVSQIGRVLLSASLFVLGFTMVFVSLGTSASLLGSLAEAYRRELILVAGGVMVLMGILIMDIIPVKLLARGVRFHPETRGLGVLGGIPLGMAFGLGWLPCVGPVLASILFFASTVETVWQGTMLLLVYSLGLGLAFILTGAFFGRALGALRWVQSHRWVFNILGGGVLVVGLTRFISHAMYRLALRTCSGRTTLPTGLQTRLISARPWSGSGTEQNTQVATTVSNVLSANSSFWTSIGSRRTFTPASWLCCERETASCH